jgi:branched-chain amino acid transport system substrate-binding protein
MVDETATLAIRCSANNIAGGRRGNEANEEAHMKIQRRTVLKSMLAGGVSLAALKMPAVRAQSAAMKIGLLTVTSGPLSQGGSQMNQGIETFLKEKNHTLAGRKIELITADTGGNPAGAKTKLSELVERDHVDMILGPFAAFELLAISDYIRQNQIPLISIASADDMTQRKSNPWVIRASCSSSQTPHAMADYCVKELKLRTMSTIANDFAFGYEECAGFQRVFEDEGGKVVQKLWPPITTPDYVPYISQFSDIDGVFNGLGGGNPIRFLQAYASLGLKDKIPMTGGWSFMDEPLLKSLGDEAIGVYSAHFYSPSIDTPSNHRFVEEMAKDYNELPGGGAAGMYVAGQVIEAALVKTGGSLDDKNAFMEAMKKVSLTDTPRGNLRFDQFGNPVGPVLIRRCERKDGKLVNTVVKTYPDVTQFWTYDVKEFLAQPAYTRDYPPAKNLR